MSDTNKIDTRRKVCPAICDIYETDGKVFCKMEMPGVNKDNLDIKVDGDRLIVHGSKSNEQVNGEYLIHEIREGDYYHEFTIDNTIDRNKLDASIKNGVVTITLGIRESEKPRKIAVTAE